MKRILWMCLAAAWPVLTFGGEPLRVKLFPEGTPTRNGLEATQEAVDAKGYIVRVSDPELLVFLPDPETATGEAVLVVPGGSYERVCVTHEGYRTARWLNRHGIAAMVLKYRMPNGRPDLPLEDGEQAMRVIRSHARQWRVDPGCVGAMGFSAGGHLVSTLITRYGDEQTRPDFAVLVYPVISMRFPSARTRDNLLGDGRDEADLRRFHSTCEHVREGMPEVMLVLCDDDRTVVPENSLLFYRALKSKGIGAEMHIYPEGGHGFWMRERYRYAEETYPAVIRWIERYANNESR